MSCEPWLNELPRQMHRSETTTMTMLLLVGDDVALLEGLTQSLAGLGHAIRMATSLADAREQAVMSPPLVAVVSRALAVTSPAEVSMIPLAPGGALVLYSGLGGSRPALPLGLRRTVLADLVLPLERNRLSALVSSVCSRARVTGREPERSPEDGREQERGI